MSRWKRFVKKTKNDKMFSCPQYSVMDFLGSFDFRNLLFFNDIFFFYFRNSNYYSLNETFFFL